MIRTKGARFAGAVTAVLMVVLGIFAVPMSASAAITVDLTDEITTDQGSTESLGGGDYFFVRFGDDAAFGIVWGNETNPNNVYFVSIVTRYLGYAQMYNQDGEVLEENHSVKVYTMYAVKLDDMVEFDDLDESGTLPYVRTYNDSENMFTSYNATEPIYKKVDFETSWTASPVVEDETDDTRTWMFSLVASNLPYEPLEDITASEVGDNVLNEFVLTFRLEAKAMQVDNASLPQWRITVNQGPFGAAWYDLRNVEKLDDIQVTGDVVTYHAKWDQTIEGWDYDPANKNPALMMEFEAIVGNAIPSGVFTWMQMLQYQRMIAYMNGFGYMHCVAESGEVQVNETTGTVLPHPKRLAEPRLVFEGEYSKIGRLSWVSNVTVDAVQAQVHAQLMAGQKFAAMVKFKSQLMAFGGFVALGAMTFPGGGLIVHDPTFSSEALVNVGIDDEPAFPLFTALVIGAIAVIIVVVIAASMSRGRPGQKTSQSYEKSGGRQQNDWSKYYSKK